jgi:hypothetical protein
MVLTLKQAEEIIQKAEHERKETEAAIITAENEKLQLLVAKAEETIDSILKQRLEQKRWWDQVSVDLSSFAEEAELTDTPFWHEKRRESHLLWQVLRSTYSAWEIHEYLNRNFVFSFQLGARES